MSIIRAFVSVGFLVLAMPSVTHSQGVADSLERSVRRVMEEGIRHRAFPGAQVWVAVGGEEVFQGTYGFRTYDSLVEVRSDDLYDLASVTKIAAATAVLMKLYEEGRIELDIPFSTYWQPWMKRKDKRDITLREILAHQAGLEPYIVFYDHLIKPNGKDRRRLLSREPSTHHPILVYRGMYVSERMKKRMLRYINRSAVRNEKTYLYSGLFFLILPELVEQLTGRDYETYLTDEIYIPLGIEDLCYNPYHKKDYAQRVVPTEYDSIFRHSLVQGWVHDENAALLGGVSGNAGLFGTAPALLRLMQMYANMGVMEGVRIFDSSTVREFTRVQYPDHQNRRGLGFDKPLIGNADSTLHSAYPAPSASPESFGHAGFTGTFVWADPTYDLIFVLLTNRVYPTRGHRAFYELHIRSRLHQIFYQEFFPITTN